MQTIKKLLAFALICSLCFPFLACGSDDEDKPIDPEKFVWNGDWNDPNDSNYKKEGYNPIKGDWINIDDSSDMLSFSSDRVLSYLGIKQNGDYYVGFSTIYTINNKSFSQGREYNPETFGNTYLYKIENNILWIRQIQPISEKWKKYKRTKF